MTTGRGYCCLDARHNMVKRFRKSGKERLVLLILSDFDPDGENIAESFARSLRDDLDVHKIEPIKVALTHAQVTDLNLPPSLKAKKGSSSYQKFAHKFGDDVFELEALSPAQLQRERKACFKSGNFAKRLRSSLLTTHRPLLPAANNCGTLA